MKNHHQTAFGRRSFLSTSTKLAGVSAAATFPFIFSKSSHAFTNDPGDAAVVKMGINTPLTGPYADGGREQVDAFNLAIQHINGEGDGGMLNTMKPLSLGGDGILGKRLEMVIGDSRTNPEAALKSAKAMVKDDGVVMLSGGSLTSSALAVQQYAQEAGVINMTAVAGGNDTTGAKRSKAGFRHFFNSYMSVAALTPVLKENYGSDRVMAMITVDNPWGASVSPVMTEFAQSIGWSVPDANANQVVSMSQKDYVELINRVDQSGADVLVLNLFGNNLISALKAIKASGIRNRPKNGNKFEVVAQAQSRQVAQTVGEDLRGIYGVVNWHWTLVDPASRAFVQSFGTEYGYPPSQISHVCYVQTLLWANACQQAGSFNPCGVAEVLEGLTFEGLGNGVCEYRADDHQVFKDIVVVQGKLNPISDFDLLEVVALTPRAKVEYVPDHPLFKGELGSITGCG